MVRLWSESKGKSCNRSWFIFASAALAPVIQILYLLVIVPLLSFLRSDGSCRPSAESNASGARNRQPVERKTLSRHSLRRSFTPTHSQFLSIPHLQPISKFIASYLLATYLLTPLPNTTIHQDSNKTSTETNRPSVMARKASERPEKRVLVRWTGRLPPLVYRIVADCFDRRPRQASLAHSPVLLQ